MVDLIMWSPKIQGLILGEFDSSSIDANIKEDWGAGYGNTRVLRGRQLKSETIANGFTIPKESIESVALDDLVLVGQKTIKSNIFKTMPVSYYPSPYIAASQLYETAMELGIEKNVSYVLVDDLKLETHKDRIGESDFQNFEAVALFYASNSKSHSD